VSKKGSGHGEPVTQASWWSGCTEPFRPVDKTALGGTPTSGWAFTIALTGQDGFGQDNARTFAPTPQPFNFGVCAAASASPLCTADPNTVPKVMDTITPTGVAQSTELDYTLGAVVLQGVTIS